ncbi:putative membrane protein [[Clostridium] bifermentans ATCC 638]|uniref:Putative membrane protein n=1 Tax=Paraclostridium bifermentans ATCC 638 = DSM 14991 TaxID=1233171 RepID=T4VH02_PARBF|nr:hypothetical protein [Paraclostridium bifermentans]EQK39957.1 putative membrane protein [[Clostridium] bifermentans ATCC 638] [Paraclostridium bifermentans ATCC 638 = DSM 14991]RIZ57523.1 hypothetical protein CHH45_16140 [Paraclostridium bifermentans]UAG19992.1 hypothetical protein KXZ80_17080 [Paraclostridium bifermentans]
MSNFILTCIKNGIIYIFLFVLVKKLKKYILLRKRMKFEEVEFGIKKVNKKVCLIGDTLVILSTVMGCIIAVILLFRRI